MEALANGPARKPNQYAPQTPESYRLIRVLLVVLFVLSYLGIALPAQAANCSHSVQQDWWVTGEQIAGLSTVNCNPDDVTYHRVDVQEKVAFAWNTQAWDDAFPSSVSHQLLVVANCAGHGNDLWRTKAYYEDEDGGHGTGYDPGSGGGWYNCP